LSPHRQSPRRLSDAIELLTLQTAPATTLARVQSVWEQTVGPAIALAARPVSEHDGSLGVICETAGWTQELTLMSADVIAQLNDALGEELLRALRCRTGPG
jgi:predicted nucleic acid-binding Zn ribbon protein